MVLVGTAIDVSDGFVLGNVHNQDKNDWEWEYKGHCYDDCNDSKCKVRSPIAHDGGIVDQDEGTIPFGTNLFAVEEFKGRIGNIEIRDENKQPKGMQEGMLAKEF